MELAANKNGAELTVCVNGEINTMTAPELSDLLDRELPGVQVLTLDLANCEYVSSAGLRVLLNAYKLMKAARGTMSLANVSEGVMDVLKNTGLDSVFGL